MSAEPRPRLVVITDDDRHFVELVTAVLASVPHLRVVGRAANGEEIILSKAGKPLAKLVPYRQPATPRQPGGWEGRIRISDDFRKQVLEK